MCISRRPEVLHTSQSSRRISVIKDRIGKILFGIAGMLIVACELVVICIETMVNIGGITYVHTAIGYLAAIILLIIGSLFIKKPVSAVVFAVMLILNIWLFSGMFADADNGYGYVGTLVLLLAAHIAIIIIYCIVTLKYLFPRAPEYVIVFIIAVALLICLFFLGVPVFFVCPFIVAIFSVVWVVSAFKKPAVESAQ